MVDRLHGLGHNPVIRSNHQDNHISDLSASGPHCRKCLVTGCVQKGDLPFRQCDLVGPDMLSNPSMFSGNKVALADGIEQQGLPVIHMPHHCNYRRPWKEFRLIILFLSEDFFSFQGNDLCLFAEGFRNGYSSIGIDDLIYGSHNPCLHQPFYYLIGRGVQSFRQFPNCNGLHQFDDIAGILLFGTSLGLFPLRLFRHRGFSPLFDLVRFDLFFFSLFGSRHSHFWGISTLHFFF